MKKIGSVNRGFKEEYILLINDCFDVEDSTDSSVVACGNNKPDPIGIMEVLSEFEDGMFCHLCRGVIEEHRYTVTEYISTFGGMFSSGI